MTPKEKAGAGLDALLKLKVTQPEVAKSFSKAWSAAKLKYTPAGAAEIAKIKDLKARKAINDWVTDPKAVKAFTDGLGSAVDSAVKGVGDAIATDAGIIGGIPPKVADAAATGLGNTFDSGVLSFLSALSNRNTWIRVAEAALGITLIVVGLVKLAGPSVANVIPATRAIKKVVK